jgi:hypothetical protein
MIHIRMARRTDAAAIARVPRADLNRLEGALVATAYALGLDIVKRTR